MRVTVGLTDVRRKGDLSDYTGQLQTQLGRSDHGRSGATVARHRLPRDRSLHRDGEQPRSAQAACSSSTFNAIVPGAVVEGGRANWEFGDVQVFDGGASGVAGASDARLFARQGVFVP